MVVGNFAIPFLAPPRGEQVPAAAPLARSGAFIAGPENALAATALALCANSIPAKHGEPDISGEPDTDGDGTANLLLFYGPNGAGKSHLAGGLADWWPTRFPDQRVVSLTGADFARQFADALDAERLEPWRNQIRSADLLVLDDLGALVKKPAAQDELHHTLDALAARGSRVVLTARTLPTHWPGFSATLRSRLSAALAVNVALPGRAARQTILEQAAASRGLALPTRLVRKLADGLPQGAPRLLAALMELDLEARAGREPIDETCVERLLAKTHRGAMPSLAEIARLTAKHFGLRVTDLKSSERRQAIVAARAIGMHLSRHLTDHSLQRIGRFYGNRDHTTVLHSCRRVATLLKQDRATRLAVVELKRVLAT